MSTPTVDSRCNAFFEPPHDYNCSECDNPMGIFTCHGCCKVFCQQHAISHREPLKQRLTRLIEENQKLDTHVDDDGHSAEHDSLRRDIDDWENNAIEKIRQAAAEARKKLADIDNGRGSSQIGKIHDCRKALTTRLERAYAKSDYHEQHLTYWEQFLEDLRQNYTRLRTNFARIEYCNRIFITKVLVVENPIATRFTKWCYYQKDAVQTIALRQSEYFQEEGCSESYYIGPCANTTTVYDSRPRPVEPRIEVMESDYTGVLQTGEYRFRLRSECRFIGIISETVHQKNAPLNTPTVYGWSTSEDAIYRDGQRQYGASNDLRPGDMLSLLISNEQQLIRLKNSTRNRTHELHIDSNKCPLPWQLKIVLTGTGNNYE